MLCGSIYITSRHDEIIGTETRMVSEIRGRTNKGGRRWWAWLQKGNGRDF